MNATLPPMSNRVAWLGLVVLLLYFGATSLARPLRHPYPWSDFVTFYSAAQAFQRGESPYETLQLEESSSNAYEGWVGRYFYPPPFAALVVRPLLALPFDVARRVWVLVETIAYGIAGVLLCRHVFGSLSPRALFTVGFVFLPFAPMMLDLRLGSVSALLLLLLAVFQVQRQRDHRTRAALALAGAIVLKLTPALLAAYLWVRGERALVVRTLGCIAALLLLALPWTGVRVYQVYVADTLPDLATANFSWFTNQSIDAFFWRLFVPNPDTTPWLDSPLAYRLGTIVASLAVLATLVRVARLESAPRRVARDAGVAAALCASVMLARVSWEYMLLLTLPAFLVVLRDVLAGLRGRRMAALLVVAWLLCAAPFPYTQAPWREGIALLLESPRLYGMTLLFVLVTRPTRHAA